MTGCAILGTVSEAQPDKSTAKKRTKKKGKKEEKKERDPEMKQNKKQMNLNFVCLQSLHCCNGSCILSMKYCNNKQFKENTYNVHRMYK
jgi:hypothetical protein